MIIEIEITLKKVALYLLLLLVIVIVVSGVYEVGYDEGAMDMLRINCGPGIKDSVVGGV